MSRGSAALRLRHMLDHAREAAGRVPEEVRARHAGIPWGQVVGLRNRLIHGCDAVDFDILRQIVTQDLSPLVEALENAVSAERAPEP